MKQLKYLNAVLTVIAICLFIIVLAVCGLIPSANARTPGKQFVSVPVNPDGSLNVKIIDKLDVNIDEIDGHSIRGSELPISLDDINMSSYSGHNLPVNIQQVSGQDCGNYVPVKAKSY
jgi:hypothetical protein